jgi:hypothetical protein
LFVIEKQCIPGKTMKEKNALKILCQVKALGVELHGN